MSKDRKKLLHIHSSVNDKQPTPATLELGELGVNNAKGNAFISTKNSDGEVVRFSEDETIIGWMEKKEVLPYEAYVRGADNSQIGMVTEQDLLNNKSNIIIKLNQVVPEYTPYDEKVNGAKDIYGNLINPISEGGYKDGAGIAIDMSLYTMNGSNPSFSSITTTCHTTLNGTTEIKGKGDGCGSKFTVDVANACVDASDTLNEYGVNHSNFGTSCDGTKISNDTTLKGKKIFIDSPSGDLTVDIQACNHISGRTNDFVIRECQDNGGKVEIDTTDIDVSASTTDVKSCDRISAITNDFQVKECAANGKAGISSTTINNSASTIDEKACTRISEVTNQFNITECTDGQGSVNVDTTSIDTTACTHNYNNTNDFKVTECTDGQGTTTIKSCKKFNVKSNDIVLEQCGNSGETHIHSCAGITLESKNITLTDGDCGSGQATIEVNDLCLVGERKINVYGDETNVGLDCDDSKIATNTRVFGKGTLITTKATPTIYAGENNIETVAAQDIKENADRDINETAGRNINETATGNINESTTNGNINESAKNINNTASNDICDTAANNASFYGANETNIGKSCDGTGISNNTTIYASTAVTINAPTTNITGNTNISGDTVISGTATIGDTLIIKKGLEKTLSWSYGNVQSATADSTNFKEDKSFVIPQCAGDIKRRTLSWSNGAANTGSYDPGASCDNTDSGTNIVIPSGLSHLTDWSNNCLNVANNLCVNGTVTATGGMYTSSDRDLKENITYIGGHDISKATRIKLKAFNYKNDPSNRKVYGVIAQDLEEIGLNELVHYDESGMRSVDYTGLLLLKLAALEKEIDILKHKLEEKNN